MSEIINSEPVKGFLGRISALDFVLWIFVILGIIGCIGYFAVRIYKLLEKYRTLRNEVEDKENLSIKNSNEIVQLKEDMNDFDNKLDNMEDNIKAINDKIDTLFKMIIEQREYEDTQERAKLKDRISQSYRFHSETKKWCKRDKESLEDLITSYEERGGTNSFVHSEVQKEMYTWEVIDE